MDKVDQKELEAYQVQLSQAELALKEDPENGELKELVSELKTLIELTEATIATQQAQAAQGKAESSRKASQVVANGKTWSAGDECLVKYSGDGHWYPARITSVGGAVENRVFSIVFKGYNTTELVKAHELKPLSASYLSGPGPYGGGGGGASGSNGAKRKLSKDEEEERERKKKKNEKKLELRAAKAKEQNEKKANWQKFAKKAERKGVHIAGVSGTSIFKTPDNPYGKVGVTGSGKGMTENLSRPKNKFAIDPNNAS